MKGAGNRAGCLPRVGSARIPDGMHRVEAVHATLRYIQQWQGFCGTDVSPFGLNLK